MKKRLTVTVGIPAHNESENIGGLLRALLSQEEKNFILKKIIVVSDGSTDSTLEVVKIVKDPKIKLINLKKRHGLNKVENLILEKVNEDVLIIINADIFPYDQYLLSKLVEPIKKNQKIGLVSCYMRCVPAETLVSKVLAYSHQIKESMFADLRGGDNVYLCHGQIRAFSKRFYKNFKWDLNSPEDSYSYFSCIKSGFKFFYTEKAEILFSPSRIINDHIKQSNRFIFGRKKLIKIFGAKLIDDRYKIPNTLLIKKFSLGFIKNPILTSAYIVMMFYIRFFMKKEPSHHSKYEISASSKSIALRGA